MIFAVKPIFVVESFDRSAGRSSIFFVFVRVFRSVSWLIEAVFGRFCSVLPTSKTALVFYY